MKEKKFLKCICCEGLTRHREHGYWVHKNCMKELEYRVMLAIHELPNIQKTLLFGTPHLLKAAILALHNGEMKKIKRIRKDIKKKAWKLLEQKYGKASWLK